MDKKIPKKFYLSSLIFRFVILLNIIFYNYKRDFLQFGFYLLLICTIVYAIISAIYRKSIDKTYKIVNVLLLIFSTAILYIIYPIIQ